MKKLTLALMAFIAVFHISAQNLSGVRIYINPGHGGFDSDDRNIVIAPYKSGDHAGFWESQSNLDKGTQLKAMLDGAGATTFISRTANTTADDLPLSQIVAAANASNADFMLSIHSNAGNGTANSVLMLYAGKDANDTYTYPTPTPVSDESRDISTVIGQNLYTNQITNWSSGISIRGDKTFGRTAMGWSDGYGVLRGLTVPGVISEGAMHDYIPETYRFMNMEYKYLEAWHFFKSFCSYFKSAQIPTGVIAGAVRDKFLQNEATYYKRGTDVYLPINGATVTLLPDNITYTTDNLYNGVYLFKNVQPGDYTIITQHADYHNDTTYVTVTANNVTYNNIGLNKIRNTPPEVIDYSPKVALTDSVLTGNTIWFKFNWDIDPESAKQAFSISPAVSGKFVLKESNYVMEFVPDAPLEKSTLYTVTLAKSLRHFDGLSMENDFTFQFKTASRNELKMIAAYPMTNEDHVDYLAPTFTFVFDKQLQTAELINGIQVYDNTGKIVTKGPRTLHHNSVQAPYGSTAFTLSQNLVPGEKYMVKLAKGIKDIDGVYLADTLYIPFTASNERITDKKIVETFETTGKMLVDNTQNQSVTSASVSSSSSTKLFDSYSYNFKYNFSEKSGGEVVYKFNDPIIQIPKDSIIGMHIYGDLSGNELYLILSSSSGTYNVKFDSIHYGGWKFSEKTIGTDVPEDQYFNLLGFKVVQTSAPLSNTGNFFVDNILVYDKIISKISSPKLVNVKIYPNPATNTIYIRTADNQTLEYVELYSLSGQKIRKTSDNFMNITDISAGTYIVKIKLTEGIVSAPLIVKK
ncbi:conserved exported hypothetical protein [uncultured Paludibacter sp.]|nr:conserved exported hypothetical protein [uncultured Paludibacter sp.]